MTTGNSSPLARCTVMMRTPSVPSSTTGASPLSSRSARASSSSTKPRNERRAAPRLVAPRHIHQAHHVGQRLLAGRPDRERRVRARRGEQARDGVGDRPAIASAMSSRSTRERGRDLARARRANRREACETDADCRPASRNRSSAPSASANSGPRSVAKTASSSSGRSIAPSALRIASTSSRSLNDPPLHQHVRDMARFERADVRPRDVAAEGC